MRCLHSGPARPELLPQFEEIMAIAVERTFHGGEYSFAEREVVVPMGQPVQIENRAIQRGDTVPESPMPDIQCSPVVEPVDEPRAIQVEVIRVSGKFIMWPDTPARKV